MRSSLFRAVRTAGAFFLVAGSLAVAQDAVINSATANGSNVTISVTVSNAPSGLGFKEVQFKKADGTTLTPTKLADTYANGTHIIEPAMPAGAAKCRIKHANGVTDWVNIS